MNSRFGIKGLAALIALLVLASLGTNAVAAGQLPALRRYRDLKVYSTSSPDKNQPAPHSLPAAAGLLTPDMKLLPLQPQGQQQVDRAPLDDPTEAASQAVTMARLPALRRTPAPWLSLTLPDPFEHHTPFPFPEPPEDERLPPYIALRVPRP